MLFRKIARGVTYFSFYCIFSTNFFENLPLGVAVSAPFPLPPHTPCVHLWMRLRLCTSLICCPSNHFLLLKQSSWNISKNLNLEKYQLKNLVGTGDKTRSCSQSWLGCIYCWIALMRCSAPVFFLFWIL